MNHHCLSVYIFKLLFLPFPFDSLHPKNHHSFPKHSTINTTTSSINQQRQPPTATRTTAHKPTRPLRETGMRRRDVAVTSRAVAASTLTNATAVTSRRGVHRDAVQSSRLRCDCNLF